jgi:hypothetical protein
VALPSASAPERAFVIPEEGLERVEPFAPVEGFPSLSQCSRRRTKTYLDSGANPGSYRTRTPEGGLAPE